MAEAVSTGIEVLLESSVELLEGGVLPWFPSAPGAAPLAAVFSGSRVLAALSDVLAFFAFWDRTGIEDGRAEVGLFEPEPAPDEVDGSGLVAVGGGAPWGASDAIRDAALRVTLVDAVALIAKQ